MATIPPESQDSSNSLAAVAAQQLLSAIAPKAALSRKGTEETPARFAKALAELTSGYKCEDPSSLLKLFPAEGYDQIIAIKGIPFVSLCEHHVMSFTGTVSVAYLPNPDKYIVGLSKVARVVRVITRRLQVQERITQEISKAFAPLEARGIAVLVQAHHTCMSLRGAESPGIMVTSIVEGVFRESASAKAEVMEILK